MTPLLCGALAVAAWLSFAGHAAAQDNPPQSGDDEQQTESSDNQQEDKQDDEQRSDGPSLDELLGIEGDDRADDAARRQSREALERELTEQQVSDAFTQAVEQMKLSAEMLGERFDTGVGTQRIQEDVIAKLDMLIENAQRQPSSSSSSDSQSSSSEQQQQDQQPGPQQQGEQQQQQNQQSGEEGDGQTEGQGPPQQDADIDHDIEETRAQWGNLPERVRDMMLQGQTGTYSNLYRTLTEEYYRRLAEESTDD